MLYIKMKSRFKWYSPRFKCQFSLCPGSVIIIIIIIIIIIMIMIIMIIIIIIIIIMNNVNNFLFSNNT